MKKILFLGILFFVIDLVSKIIICNTLFLNKSVTVINNFFCLTYTKNTGAAFSILQNNRFFLIVISVFILFVIIFYIRKNDINSFFEIFGYSLVIGGLLGNLFDRIIYGYVIDFFDFYIFGCDFAIFNVADCFIVIGIIIIVISCFRRHDKDENCS